MTIDLTNHEAIARLEARVALLAERLRTHHARRCSREWSTTCDCGKYAADEAALLGVPPVSEAIARLTRERDEALEPTWACRACGASGPGFSTVHYPAGDADVQCPKCGSCETDEIDQALSSVVLALDDAEARTEAAEARVAEYMREVERREEIIAATDARVRELEEQISETESRVATFAARVIGGADPLKESEAAGLWSTGPVKVITEAIERRMDAGAKLHAEIAWQKEQRFAAEARVRELEAAHASLNDNLRKLGNGEWASWNEAIVALSTRVRELEGALRWALDAFEEAKREGLLGGDNASDAEFDHNVAPIRAALGPVALASAPTPEPTVTEPDPDSAKFDLSRLLAEADTDNPVLRERWLERADEAVEELRADCERLREALRKAPHAFGCGVTGISVERLDLCTCWKRAALAGSPPAAPTERKPLHERICGVRITTATAYTYCALDKGHSGECEPHVAGSSPAAKPKLKTITDPRICVHSGCIHEAVPGTIPSTCAECAEKFPPHSASSFDAPPAAPDIKSLIDEGQECGREIARRTRKLARKAPSEAQPSEPICTGSIVIEPDGRGGRIDLLHHDGPCPEHGERPYGPFTATPDPKHGGGR